MVDNLERITPHSPGEFRVWLHANHATAAGVWVVYHKVHTGVASLTWSQAVDQALCFGWIDSTARRLDADRYEQYFTRRKPNSPWSKVNKNKIAALAAANLIEPAGREAIDAAIVDGSWVAADAAEACVVPDDLAAAFTKKGRSFFDALSPSRRKYILQWIASAKRDDTRLRRITETAAATDAGLTPRNI